MNPMRKRKKANATDAPAIQIADGVKGTVIAGTRAIGMKTFIDAGNDTEMTLIDNVHIPDPTLNGRSRRPRNRSTAFIPELPWTREGKSKSS